MAARAVAVTGVKTEVKEGALAVPDITEQWKMFINKAKLCAGTDQADIVEAKVNLKLHGSRVLLIEGLLQMQQEAQKLIWAGLPLVVIQRSVQWEEE